jgi:hypothetical protein
MEILRSTYSASSNLTVATVEVNLAVTPTVSKMDGVYKVTLQGNVTAGSDEMYEKCLDELEAAGINLMPF